MTKYWLGKHREEGSKPPLLLWRIWNSLSARKISLAMKGKEKSLSTRLKMSRAQKGRIVTKEMRLNMSKSRIGKYRGEKSPNWEGGVTPLNRLLRSSANWKIWRETIFLRDNFTCQNPNCEYCHNKMGVILHPHHIKSLSKYPKLAFDVNNGITYCCEFHLMSGLHRRRKGNVKLRRNKKL